MQRKTISFTSKSLYTPHLIRSYVLTSSSSGVDWFILLAHTEWETNENWISSIVERYTVYFRLLYIGSEIQRARSFQRKFLSFGRVRHYITTDYIIFCTTDIIIFYYWGHPERIELSAVAVNILILRDQSSSTELRCDWVLLVQMVDKWSRMKIKNKATCSEIFFDSINSWMFY